MKIRFPISIYKVSGHSMEPTFKAGDLVITFNYGFPKVGDGVLFWQDQKVYFKRVDKVKDGLFYLVGDNRIDSLDSRSFGWVEKKNLIGKVVKKF